LGALSGILFLLPVRDGWKQEPFHESSCLPEALRPQCAAMRDDKALFVLALVAVLWSSGGLAIKLVEAHPLAIAGLRSALALLTLLAITRFRPGLTWSRTQILGGVCYMILLVTGVTATRLTTAANAILLAYTAPVYVALIAPRLLGEPTRRADWIMIAAVLGGM
jgi:EamA-like transporter family.